MNLAFKRELLGYRRNDIHWLGMALLVSGYVRLNEISLWDRGITHGGGLPARSDFIAGSTEVADLLATKPVDDTGALHRRIVSIYGNKFVTSDTDRRGSANRVIMYYRPDGTRRLMDLHSRLARWLVNNGCAGWYTDEAHCVNDSAARFLGRVTAVQLTCCFMYKVDVLTGLFSTPFFHPRMFDSPTLASRVTRALEPVCLHG